VGARRKDSEHAFGMKSVSEKSVVEIGGYELAEELTGIRRSTLYGMVCRRQIPHFKLAPRVIRFRRADLEKWLESCFVEAR